MKIRCLKLTDGNIFTITDCKDLEILDETDTEIIIKVKKNI